MKKKTIIFIFISVMLLGCNMPSVHALDMGSISEYYNVINEVNEEYNANLYILTKSEFDTSYKPSVSVKKLSNTNYFSMSSWSGTFKNSNKTFLTSFVQIIEFF